MMNTNSIRIVQVSDTHLYADPKKTLLGVPTYESFIAVLNLIKSDPIQPDLILLTGDLSQDHTEESYQALAQALVDFSMPIYFIPGNHDDIKRMERVLPCKNIFSDKHILLDSNLFDSNKDNNSNGLHWQIILLNSQKPHAVEGELAKNQLEFLDDCLKKYPEHHAIAVFHHQPMPIGCQWLDRLCLTNAEDLWTLLKNFPFAKHILFGHVHQEHMGEKNGVTYYSVPSTCIQFKRNSADFDLEKLPQGYRWVDIYPNGELKTGVTRLSEYIGLFDPDAKGY